MMWWLAMTAFAQEEALDLAAALLRDGHPHRAALALAEVDPDTVDPLRLYSLTGLVAVAEERHVDAVSALTQARSHGALEPVVLVHLGQELLTTGDPVEALAVLDASVDDVAAAWLVRSRAHIALNAPNAAYEALMLGSAQHPADLPLVGERARFLAERGLSREAGEASTPLLHGDDPVAVLRVAEALRDTAPMRAVELLEAARLAFPEHVDVSVHLAAAWLGAGQPASAGAVLQAAIPLDASLAMPAAAAFQEAGDIDRALYLNSLVTDPHDKARQRLGLLIASERYDSALALGDRMQRLGLTSEDAVAYALAFAHYQVGHFRLAEDRLAGISDPDVFSRATALRSAIARCEEAPWTCR